MSKDLRNSYFIYFHYKTPIARQTSPGNANVATNRSTVTGSNKREHPAAEKEVKKQIKNT